MVQQKSKNCASCKKLKYFSDFTVRRSSSDGLHVYCRECSRYKNKEWVLKNQDKKREIDKNRYEKNKEKILKKVKEYYSKNKKYLMQKIWERRKTRMGTDLNFRLKSLLRGRLNKAIRKKFKAGSAIRDLGCDIEYFKSYIENLFQEGMTWDNWGRGPGKTKWHLDHIIPLSSFDLSDPKQVSVACNYKNIRPMWAEDNIRKGERNG